MQQISPEKVNRVSLFRKDSVGFSIDHQLLGMRNKIGPARLAAGVCHPSSRSDLSLNCKNRARKKTFRPRVDDAKRERKACVICAIREHDSV